MVALVIRECLARQRSNKTVRLSVIITLLLQRRLHIGNNLIGREVIIPVDGAVPGIIGVRRVAPGGEPVTGVPIIRGAEYKNDIVMVMTMPPVLIVPL